MVKPRDMQVFEILNELQEQSTTQNRVKILQTTYADHQPLFYILKWNFDNDLMSLLPEGDAPLSDEDKDGSSPQSLWSYLKMFPRFVDCPAGRQTPALRREALFLEMLESLDKAEAEAVTLAKDKNLTTKWDKVTIDVVQQAFPDMITAPAEVAAPLSDEDRAKELLDYAEELKKQARELNKEAKEVLKEATKLADKADKAEA